ncbi:MAG: hypothetical protein E7551_07360 [Ruminococcaceae bacterium]|nr:hypothetical protein [Oscillospiraceae bacterium]
MNTINILNHNPIQQNFYGFNAVYHGFAGLSDNSGRVLNEELCELEADRAKDQNIKIARTFYKWYSYDFENERWDWENSPDYLAFCKWVERMKVREIDVGLNAGWCLPGDILSNSWNGKSPFTVEGDWAASVENFAKWVSDSVYDLVIKKGLTNVKYLFLFTEPQRGAGALPKEVPNIYEAWYRATKAVAEQLKNDKLNGLVKIVGPQEGSTCNAQMMKWMYDNHPDVVDFYSSHNYSETLTEALVDKSVADIKWINIAGGRWSCPVKLIPDREYELSFKINLQVNDYKSISGYLLAGAFRRNPETKGVFGSGGVPTDRLDRFSTVMLEAARLDKAWQTVNFKFTAPNDVKDALIGFFADIKGEEFDLFIGETTLKLCGSNGADLDLNQWLAFPITNQYAANNYYDFWCADTKDKINLLGANTPLWYDEYNCRGAKVSNKVALPSEPIHGTNLAAARIAFLNCGIQNSFMWTLFDQQWPNNHISNSDWFYDGDHRYGVMPCLLRSKVPYPAYFAMRITSLVNGDSNSKIYKGVEKGIVRGAMVENSDGNITILLINETDENQDFEITFEKSISADLNCYIYNPEKVVCEENIPSLKADLTIKNATNNIKYNIPAKGVIAFSTK